MFGYAGFRAAHRARDRYGKLLAAGLTSLILAQASINLFAVLGLAPLTGRAAAVRLLRRDQPDRHPRRGGADPERGAPPAGAPPRASGAEATRRARAVGPRPLRDCGVLEGGGANGLTGDEELELARVVIAAGGTAGHVVPAIAVADALRDSGRADVSFIGTRDRAEAELVPAAGYEIDFLAVERPEPPQPAARPRSRRRAPPRRCGAAKRHPARARADAVLGGGGYVAGPVGLAAAARLGLPAGADRGRQPPRPRQPPARLAARARVCLAFPIEGREGEPYLVTGRPVPRAVLEADRRAARRRFGDPRGRLGCVAVVRRQPRRPLGQPGRVRGLRRRRGGRRRRPRRQAVDPARRPAAATTPSCSERWVAGRRARSATCCSSTSPRWATCWRPADLVVARAGGSVMEIAAAGRPAILVPYPHATADHQTANARWMADRGRRDRDPGRRAHARAPARRGRRRCWPTTRAWRRWRAAVQAPRQPGRRRADRRRGPGGGCGGRERRERAAWRGGGCTSSRSAAPA